MAEVSPSQSCKACDAQIPPGLRYCVYCYRPVDGEVEVRIHQKTAEQFATTRRADPTLVVSPSLRPRRRHLALIAAAAVTVVLGGIVLLVWELQGGNSPNGAHRIEREQMAKRELVLLSEALESFNLDIGRYPTSEEGLSILYRRPSSSILEGWSGPYMEGIIEVDPWGNDYVYRATSGARAFELLSHGPDGEQSGKVFLFVTSEN